MTRLSQLTVRVPYIADPRHKVPYLVDPNTGVSMGDSEAIIKYLFETYRQQPETDSTRA